MSEERNPMADLYGALAKARAKIVAATKDESAQAKDGKAYRYADLATVQAACLPALAEQGLSVIQAPLVKDGFAGCRTMLVHAGGGELSTKLLLPLHENTVHAVGSCITYARRYSLAAVAQVPVGDADDDGAAAMKGAPKAKPAASKGRAPKAAKPAAKKTEAAAPSNGVPKTAADVVAQSGPHEGKSLPHWSTPYLAMIMGRLAKGEQTERNAAALAIMKVDLKERVRSAKADNRVALDAQMLELAADPQYEPLHGFLAGLAAIEPR